MVGWRYNPVNDCVEFVPYWHDENGGAHFDYEPLRIPFDKLGGNKLTIKINALTLFSLRKVHIVSRNFIKSWSLPQNAYMGTGWMISPWFGGQQVAQKLIRFFIKHR